MKIFYALSLVLLPTLAQAQLKEIAFAELTGGSGMFFGAQMSPTTITVTVQGPADRFLAFGFGTGMASGNDAIIWSTLGTGVAPLQLRDHRMIGTGAEPTVDAQQDWTVISNNVAGSNRTIVASRALNTGDANDVTFLFSATTQNLFWAKGPSATNQLQNHGGSNRASGIVRNWVAVDQTAPTLSSTNPVDNTSGVSLTQNLTMNFSENVSMGTGFISLYDSNDNLIQQVTNGSPGLNVLGSSIIWNPTANLVMNTDYYVQIDATAVKDAANNFYTGIADETTWNFNTNDIVAPALASSPFIPADNSSGVALDQNLSVTFNEPIVLGSGSIELYDNAGTLIEAFVANSSPLVSLVGSTVTINPTNDLVLNTLYYVFLTNGVVIDMSGNVYAQMFTNTTWNWNTNDLIAPTLVAPFVPADNAVDVSVNPTCSINFNEDVQLNATGSLNVFDALGNLVESFNESSGGIGATGNTVQFVFSSLLNESTAYYVQISNNFISDLSGNNFAGISDQTTWSFTTGDFTAPTHINLQPLDNDQFVPEGTMNAVMFFSEDIELGSGSFFLVNENNGQTEEFNNTLGNITIQGGNAVILNLASGMPLQVPYHVLVDNDAIQDAAGNMFAGISDTTEWNWRIELENGLIELGSNLYSWNGTDLILKTGNVSGEIYDISGKRIQKLVAEKTSLEHLSTGIYTVWVLQNNTPTFFRIYVD